ncbi:MAG: SDR family NAD(P)-dependent oxidoreductase [Alphaproteobacteria bacterium]|nr:SDR family NAD(P)-dependent oxidoreductase [Alphaproteobacteria bacterium]
MTTGTSSLNTPSSDTRIAVVTGASRGFGRAVALELAKAGMHVIITGRTLGALEELDDEIRSAGGSATLLRMDMRKGDMIDQLGPTIFERWGRLDVLVANAALLGPLSPLGHITADTWEQVIDTNLNANWRLLRTLDPLLQKSDSGRVVFVSSGAASGRNAYWGPYAVSKAGVEALAHTYAAEVANSKIRVNIVNPGAMRTAMRAKAFPGEDATTLPEPKDVAPMVVDLASAACDTHDQVVTFRDWKNQQESLETKEGANVPA